MPLSILVSMSTAFASSCVVRPGFGTRVGHGSAGWEERAAKWIKVVQLDAAVAMLIGLVITAGYFLVGCAVLHGDGDARRRTA